MPQYSKKSASRLKSCEGRLQLVFNIVIVEYDCSILEGYRGENKQNEFFKDGKTKVKYPNSRHNRVPSFAVDVAPWVLMDKDTNKWGIPWNDHEKFRHFAGYVLGVGDALRIRLKWGGNWSRSMDYRNNNFEDLVHFQLEGV